MMETTGNVLFPVFLKLDKLQVLIIGGGSVGAEKLRFMLKSSPNANVTLLAKTFSGEIQSLAKANPHVQLIDKAFEVADLNEKDIIIAATEKRDINEYIYKEAKKWKLLVNVADTPDLCDFYLSAIVTKGDLKIAISTNGKSPTFAKRFRVLLEEILPDELPQVLSNLKVIRERLKGDFSNKVKELNKITENMVANGK